MSFIDVLNKIKSPDVVALFLKMKDHPISEELFHTTIFQHRQQLRNLFHEYFEENNLDIIFYPTMPSLPATIEEFKHPKFEMTHNGRKVPQLAKSIQNTDPAS
mmetsp:Transcript_46101/g.33897  ORF Transcript_46101/g.33897 Transcript_46101/m.33897 type:complete len:103 (-) Transcript_46101:180-488(-)